MYEDDTCECCRSFRIQRNPLDHRFFEWWCKEGREDQIDEDTGRCRHFVNECDWYDHMRQMQKDGKI